MTAPDVAQVAANFLAVIDGIAKGYETNVPFRLSMLRSVVMTTDEIAIAAAQHLVDNGYAYWSRDEDGGPSIRVTRVGFAHVRRMMSDAPVEVPAPNITNITNSTVGAVQQGTSHSSQRVDQTNYLTQAEALLVRGFLSDAHEVIQQLGLDERAFRDAQEWLRTLDVEANREEPRRRVIRTALEGLRTIAYGAAGSGAWATLEAALEAIS